MHMCIFGLLGFTSFMHVNVECLLLHVARFSFRFMIRVFDTVQGQIIIISCKIFFQIYDKSV